MFIVGSIIAVTHYIPPPPADLVVSANIQPGPKWYTDQMARYAENPFATFIHVAPAFVFMVIALLQVWPGFRQKHKKMHKLLGRIFITNAILIMVSALYLAFVMPYSGLDETIVSCFIVISFMVSLVMGIKQAMRNNYTLHREWMSRMLAVGMAPVSMRFFYGAILLYYPDVESTVVFAPTMWAGLILNIVVVEIWLGYTRSPRVNIVQKYSPYSS